MKTSDKKYATSGTVVENRLLCGNWHRIVVHCPQVASAAKPGQFAQIGAWTGSDPLIRRPLGIAGVEGETFSLLLQTVGRGTELIASKQPGEKLDIIGPLGNGFPEESQGKFVWLIAGGTGIAPILFLLSAWKFHETRLYYGARAAADCGAISLLPEGAIITTETGDAGRIGLVTEALAADIADVGREPDFIFACGPMPMMRQAHKMCQEPEIPCHVSLEAHMGCGFGACLGCAVPGADRPYYHVCAEGPVFNSEKIGWDKF